MTDIYNIKNWLEIDCVISTSQKDAQMTCVNETFSKETSENITS